MSQEAQIIQHLKRNTLTPMEALKLYGCFRLASRVNTLRNQGHVISTEMVDVRGKRVARYKLIKQRRNRGVSYE